MKRTKAQRRWIKRGYPREMIALVPGLGISYLMRASEDWRSQRPFARMIGMPIRPVHKQFIQNGRKPR
jgi:hypothetical protein